MSPTTRVKSLMRTGSRKTGKSGGESFIQVTDKGLEELIQIPWKSASGLLVEAMKVSGPSQEDLSGIASHLRELFGYYEQAARSAAIL